MKSSARFGILLGPSDWTRYIVYQAIDKTEIKPEFVIIENNDAVRYYYELKKRWNRYGLLQFIDQILLQGYLMLTRPWRFLRDHKNSFSNVKIERIHSANSTAFIELIRTNRLDYLICMASSIIKKDTLDNVHIPMINIHPGLNPWYRGAGGNFWAIYNNDMQMIGVTAHLMKAAIDAGDIVYREKIDIKSTDDTFEKITYKVMEACLEELLKLFRNNFEILYKPEKPEGNGIVYGWYGLSHYLRMNSNLKQYCRFLTNPQVKA